MQRLIAARSSREFPKKLIQPGFPSDPSLWYTGVSACAGAVVAHRRVASQ